MKLKMFSVLQLSNKLHATRLMQDFKMPEFTLSKILLVVFVIDKIWLGEASNSLPSRLADSLGCNGVDDIIWIKSGTCERTIWSGFL